MATFFTIKLKFFFLCRDIFLANRLPQCQNTAGQKTETKYWGTIAKMAQKTKYGKHVENSTMWSILKIIWEDPLREPKKYDKIYEQPHTKINYMYRKVSVQATIILVSVYQSSCWWNKHPMSPLSSTFFNITCTKSVPLHLQFIAE